MALLSVSERVSGSGLDDAASAVKVVVMVRSDVTVVVRVVGSVSVAVCSPSVLVDTMDSVVVKVPAVTVVVAPMGSEAGVVSVEREVIGVTVRELMVEVDCVDVVGIRERVPS